MNNDVKLKNVYAFILKSFKNALFVKGIKCINCNSELNTKNKYCICSKCLKQLPYNNGHTCYKCGDKITGSGSYCLNCKDTQKEYEQARSPFLYSGIIQKLIYKLKYSKGKYLANYLSLFLVDEFIKHNWQVDLVVPVPLYKKREKLRGFNQAHLLSSEFEKSLNIKISKNELIRVKNTPTQTKLSKNERKNNLQKAFKVVNKNAFKNKNVLLIDDIFTTGATVDECSTALKKAGAKNIYVLTLAHVNKSLSTY
jgi:ComF family protein